MSKLTIAAALLAAVALAGCEENAVQTITAPQTGARIKFFNFGVVPTGATLPGVNFYANDSKVTGVVSTTGSESTTGTSGGAASGGLYSALAPGQYTFTGRITATTDNGLAIATAAATLADGKAYSMYISGVYDAAAKRADSFIVEDVLPGIDFTVTQVRFVNASPTAAPMTLYLRATTTDSTVTTIGGSVAYKSAGTFTSLPGGSYDIYVRTAGATTNAIARTGVSFVNGRVYTVTARGDVTVTSTTAPNRGQLDNTANR